MTSKLKNGFAETIKSSVWTLKFYWRLNPWWTLTSLVANSISEISFILNTYVFARGIDILLSISKGESSMQQMYLIVFLFFLVTLLQEGLRQVSNYSDRMLSACFYPRFQQELYRKLIAIGIQQLELPEVNNLIDRTKRNTNYINRVFDNITNFVGLMTTIVGSGAVVIVFAPHLVPLFVVALIPSVLLDRKYMKAVWGYNRDLREESRSAYQSASYLQDSNSLKELIVTRSYSKLSDHFESFMSKWVHGLQSIRRRWYASVFGFRLVRAGVEAYANIYIFMAFIAGKITLGNVTFFVRQASSFASSINGLANTANGLYEASLNINEARELFEMPEEPDGELRMDILKMGPGISISDVSFTYPRSKKSVFKDLNLEIKPGEKVAIVGHNGAGKTTLVKLLLRFYRVSEGDILINSHNVNELKISDWYRNTSVLFQDYNTYENLTVRDNIVIGNLKKKGTKKRVSHAAAMADAYSFIDAYSNKYRQVLSEKYKGGIRPSTGQWQKLAIARFFYRNAPLVIFDEPTASIDAVSEQKIFNKIYKFFEKKTVIIISHRFSTVRNADRIIVIDNGRVAEEGSHDELIKLKGKYAEAFNMQAEGYK